MTAIATAPVATATRSADEVTPTRRRLVRAACVAAGGAATLAIFSVGKAFGAPFTIADPGAALFPMLKTRRAR